MSAGDAQKRVQASIDRMVASGAEVGLQVAVVKHGRQVVVDAVSGLGDAHRGVAVTPGMLFYATSTAKGLAAAVAHVLVERGQLDYHRTDHRRSEQRWMNR